MVALLGWGPRHTGNVLSSLLNRSKTISEHGRCSSVHSARGDFEQPCMKLEICYKPRY